MDAPLDVGVGRDASLAHIVRVLTHAYELSDAEVEHALRIASAAGPVGPAADPKSLWASLVAGMTVVYRVAEEEEDVTTLYAALSLRASARAVLAHTPEAMEASEYLQSITSTSLGEAQLDLLAAIDFHVISPESPEKGNERGGELPEQSFQILLSQQYFSDIFS